MALLFSIGKISFFSLKKFFPEQEKFLQRKKKFFWARKKFGD